MPRELTITYDQVAAIADHLKANGTKPNPRLILNRHGSGSLGTIHRFFKQWEAGQERKVEASLALPAPVQRAILDFMSQELTQAKAALEAQLVESQEEATELARENERQAGDLEAQTATIEQLQGDVSTLTGQLSVLEKDLAAARDEAAREREAAEHARTEQAKLALRLQSMPLLEKELQDLRDKLQTIDQAREKAERDLAVAKSQAEGLSVQLQEQKRHSTELISRMDADKKRLESELANATQDVRAGAAEISKLQGQLTAMVKSPAASAKTGQKGSAAAKTTAKK